MQTTKALGWLLAVSLGVLAAPALLGCGGTISDGGGGGEGGAGAGQGGAGPGGGGQGGAGGFGDADARAMTWAQIEATQGTTTTGTAVTSTATGGGLDPATQFLLYGGGTETPECDAPYGSGACGGWSAHISIAPALFQPGVIPFSDPGLDITFFESVVDASGACSGGGGGSFDQGQLEIVEITSSTVHFVVSGVPLLFDNDPNGERVAARCP